MTRAGEEEHPQHEGDGEEPATSSNVGRGRILVAGLIGAAMALAGIAADTFL